MNSKINPKPTNTRPQSSISNHVVNKGSGTVNLENYLESTLNPSDNLDVLTQDSSTQDTDLKICNETQANPEDFSFDTETAKDGDSLLMALGTPAKVNDNTPSQSVNRKHSGTFSKVAAPVITPLATATSKNRGNGTKVSKEDTEVNITYNDLTSVPPLKNCNDVLGYKNTGFYSSPYLRDEFKPSISSLEIPQELEPLKPLILSQHEVFSQPIKDLGNINLVLSKIIEKKKESFNHLKNGTRIPRSLRIKCELTTSPSYANNEDFLELKESLQTAVAKFVQEGTKVMSAWANTNIQLLIHDRCTDIHKKALHILDSLTSFYTEILGTPSWPSLPSSKYISLFLFKLYFSNDYIETSDIVNFFELPADKILLLGTKILIGTDDENEACKLLSNISFSYIDDENPIDESIISETLISFDQIIRTTTIDLWKFQQERNKKHTAAQNLKAKMKAAATVSATTATAQALIKATENINMANATQQYSNLRISNLEKNVRRNEHKTNTLMKELISKKLMQKNLHGDYRTGSVDTPEISTLPYQTNIHNKTKQRIIDLSTDDAEDTTTGLATLGSPPHYHKRTAKKQRRDRNPQSQNGKKIQWKDSECKSFNPHLPVATTFKPPPQTNNPSSLNISPELLPYMQIQPENSLAANGYNWRIPLPQTNVNPFQQQQNVFGSQGTNSCTTGNPFAMNYQQMHPHQHSINPFTTNFQQVQMNQNTYNPTRFFPQGSNVTTKENPFGAFQNFKQN
jgi:hypothetical protein